MCEYCEKGKHLEEENNHKLYLEIYGKHLRIIGNNLFGFTFGRDIMINFCPMCR